MTEKPTKSREVILDALMQILEKGGSSNIVLSRKLADISGEKKEDRAFITRVTEGVIERLLTIDAGLDEISKVPVSKMKPLIREILRMSVYQILYMDRVPERAAVNEAVKLAVTHGFSGLSGFVNGVLREVIRSREAFVFTDPERRYSMPSWIIERWEAAYGPEKTERMLQGLFDVRPLSMHVVTSRASAGEVMDLLSAEGIKAKASPFSDRILLLSDYDSVNSLGAFLDGLVFAQDLSSSLVGEAAGIHKGDLIVDVCAAPGGKSMDAADRLDGSGLVIARDRSEEKAGLIRENRDRLKMKNIRVEVWDASCYDESLCEMADVVIADLPCSGLGDMAKKPEIRYRSSPGECKRLTDLQRELLSVAARYVKPGGRLIYSTCTVNREENEDQRDWFLSRFPFRPEPLTFPGEKFSEKETMKDGYLQLLPGIDPADGFFLSAFVRK